MCLKQKGVGPKEIAIQVAAYVWMTLRDLGYGAPLLVQDNMTGNVCAICQHCKKEFARGDENETFCVMCWTWVQAKRWRLFWRRYNKKLAEGFKKGYRSYYY